MNTEPPGFVTACGNYAPATATPYNKRFADKPGIVFAFYGDKECVEVEVYDVPFHSSKIN
jgi:hypothetical protein